MASKGFLKVKTIVTSVVRDFNVTSRCLQIDIPGPKYFPLLGPLNELVTMGKPEK